MALVASSLSQICKAISSFVSAGLNTGGVTVFVTLGNPGESVAGESEGHRLNLFFFRFETYQFNADVLPGENLLMRMHCIVTPFAVLEDSISAGENDLRLVGEVLRIFHEQPVFLLSADSQQFEVQVILQNLGLDQINQLWSTQGETLYRPSLLYEVSLAPVIPNKKSVTAPLAGALGLDVEADLETVATGSVAAAPPDVAAARVDTAREEWAPLIAFVSGGACLQSVSFALGSPELSAFTPAVWIAGLLGAAVQLRWDVWDSVSGWQTQSSTTPATVATASLDPAQAASATTVTAALPFTEHAGQAVLYAVRSYARGFDGTSVTVRSNPLLVNLYAGGP